jgi:hypothetical protein
VEERVQQGVRQQLIGMIDDALGEEPKRALIATRQLKAELQWLTERSVAVARREGYDWGRIGRLLGITRQSARERFKAAPPRLPPHVVARNRYLADEREGERLIAELGKAKRRGQDEGDVVPW